jgi:Fur family peroxide stress response transcriptional regulator
MNDLVQKLRSHKISVTPQRLALLGALGGRRDHPSAEQLFVEVRQQLPAISFNTVYKTLEAFSHKGLVIKVNPLHAVARYDGTTESHAHLICRSCQRILDLPGPVEPAAILPAGLKGFKVENQSLVLWGLCPDCQLEESAKEK